MKLLNYFFLFNAVFFLFQGCAPKILRVPPADTIPLENALLWKIEGNGLRQASYLFGTMHVIDESDFFWPNGIEDAISNADLMVFEIDMAKINSPLAYLSIFSHFKMKKDTTLDMLLSKEEFAEVEAAFISKYGKIPFFNRIKPLFLSQMMELKPEETSSRNNSIRGKLSYEAELYKYAKEYNIPSNGLETVRQQLMFFDKIPYKLQAQMLLESIQKSPGDEDRKLIELYRKQDINHLASIIRDGAKEDTRFSRVLISERNRTWIPKMEKYMRKKSVLFAVGAGHLGGLNGVLPLLKARGYTIQPMSVSSFHRNRIKI